MVLFLSYIVFLYAECEAQSSPFRAVGLSLERGPANLTLPNQDARPVSRKLEMEARTCPRELGNLSPITRL